MTNPIQGSQPKRLLKSLLISLPMGLLTLVMLTRLDFSRPEFNLAAFIVYALVNYLFLMMVHTGKVDRYRAILFVIASVAFSISFIWTLYAARGHFMVVTDEDIAACRVPFCHIVIPQILFTALLKQEFNFPGAMSGFKYSIPTMLVMWLAITLVLGRGWCGWVCFFGGWEDGCARLKRTPAIKTIPQKLLLLPFAVLLAVILLSTLTLSPQYCWWVCPFKAVSEFVEPSSLVRIVQIGIMIIGFIGLVVILPWLAKRRMQCALLCPFGAFQSLTNKISPFELRIDHEKCVQCMKCSHLCPVFAWDETTIKNGTPRVTCLKCGKCADHCPKNAILYHIKGTKLTFRPYLSKIVFLYTAHLFLTAIGGGFTIDVLSKIILAVKGL